MELHFLKINSEACFIEKKLLTIGSGAFKYPLLLIHLSGLVLLTTKFNATILWGFWPPLNESW